MDRLDVAVIISDKGLCGGFNDELLRALRRQVDIHRRHNIAVTIFGLGKRAKNHLGKEAVYPEIDISNSDAGAKLMDLLVGRFLEKKSDGAVIAFNRFRSAVIQEPGYWDVVPLHWRGQGTERKMLYSYEPGYNEALSMLANSAILTTIRQAFLESSAAELAARMMAMDKATKSADDMISSLDREYHKARQASITTDLMDIINGAELLRAEAE